VKKNGKHRQFFEKKFIEEFGSVEGNLLPNSIKIGFN
jgi:hypothetical protein